MKAFIKAEEKKRDKERKEIQAPTPSMPAVAVTSITQPGKELATSVEQEPTVNVPDLSQHNEEVDEQKDGEQTETATIRDLSTAPADVSHNRSYKSLHSADSDVGWTS